MQELNNTPMQENQEEESFNIYEIIFKYLVYIGHGLWQA